MPQANDDERGAVPAPARRLFLAGSRASSLFFLLFVLPQYVSPWQSAQKKKSRVLISDDQVSQIHTAWLGERPLMLTAFGPAGDLTLRDGATSQTRDRYRRGGLKTQQKCAWNCVSIVDFLTNNAIIKS